MDERFERRAPWVPWAVTSALLLVVAVVAYFIGAHREAAVVADSGERVWRFHMFPGFFAILFFFWFFGMMRWMFWGGWWGPWRHHRRYYHAGWRDWDREDLEDWHRREHERWNAPRPSGPPPAEGGQRPV
jgi:hypothetical protein